MTDEHLRARPHPGLSSLAWLLWHMTRAEDVGINLVIAQHPQVLDEDGWATQLNMPLRDIAAGMADQEVRLAGAFGANAEWAPQRWLGKPKGFTLMHTVLAHTCFQLGQCEDIRSLFGFRAL